MKNIEKCRLTSGNHAWCQNPDNAVNNTPASKVRGANMGPTWVLPAPDGSHVGPRTLLSGMAPDTLDPCVRTAPLLRHEQIAGTANRDISYQTTCPCQNTTKAGLFSPAEKLLP